MELGGAHAMNAVSQENLVIEPQRTMSRLSLRYVRRWQAAAAVAFAVAVVMTALFTWQFVKSRQQNADLEDLRSRLAATRQGNPEVSYGGSQCPKLPLLSPLPLPLPAKVNTALEEVQNYLGSLINESALLPAVSCNVFYKNAAIWQHHYGTKVATEDLRPDGDTRYRIGSITKVFAVLLVYKLYEDGLIHSLDDPLNKYAPEFHINNPFTRDNITIRQIAGQMSGLPREAPCIYRCIGTSSYEQLLQLHNRSLVVPPETMPSYSNVGYALLGRLITEKLLQGVTFEEWTKKEILDPLKMTNTGFNITPEVEDNMALPYSPGEKRYPFMNLGWLAPAGQMYSTLNDLTKLGMFFSQPDKQTLFRPSSLREMMLPKSTAPDGITLWGSPWEMEFLDGFVIRGKGGSVDTYSAFFTVVPELELGMTVLISTVYYLQGGPAASQVTNISDTIYKKILPAINETLFTLQENADFPIDSSPYVGLYNVSETNLATLKTQNYVVDVKEHGGRLVAKSTKLTFTVRYIGQPLLFQAKELPGKLSCLLERLGIYQELYFELPDEDTKRSPGFRIPGWMLEAARLPA